MEKNFKTVKTMSRKYPEHSEASLRYWLFNRNANGLSKHVRQIGRKILIDENGFLNWIETNGGAS